MLCVPGSGCALLHAERVFTSKSAVCSRNPSRSCILPRIRVGTDLSPFGSPTCLGSLPMHESQTYRPEFCLR